MPTFPNFETVFFTLAFIVPGFILTWTLSGLIPSQKREAGASFLHCLVLSCLNYAAWVGIEFLITRPAVVQRHPVLVGLGWTWVVFLGPIAIALLLALVRRYRLVKQALERIGFTPLSPIPTAWDFHFCDTARWWFVLITFKDGGNIAGLYGNTSFASVGGERQDIYLEEIYRVIGSDQPWQRVIPVRGAWVPITDVRHVEFFPC